MAPAANPIYAFPRVAVPGLVPVAQLYGFWQYFVQRSKRLGWGFFMALARDTTRNRLLSSLTQSDFELLCPLLTPIALEMRKKLQLKGQKIESIYFLEQGIASIVVNAGDERRIEIGLVGREGVTGLPLIMGAEVSPNDTFMQTAGFGLRVNGQDLLRAMDESPSLRAHLILYAHTLMTQISYTALSDGRFKLDERLARWLVMARDRAEDDTLTLTHEFLAIMLGVRRAGVTTTLLSLEHRSIIQTKRGAITILDRDALIDAANGSYGAPEAEFERLFPGPREQPPEAAKIDSRAAPSTRSAGSGTSA